MDLRVFNKLRRAKADLATMNVLFSAAERFARADGIQSPGAEHLLLAALDLQDGLAKQALATFSVNSADLRDAIVAQHEETLRSIGVFADDNAIAAALPASRLPKGPYRAQGSQQIAFQRAVVLAREDGAPLNSAYLLLAATESEIGTVARSLEHLGVDRDQLRRQARLMLPPTHVS